jgi:predicted membrane protein
MPSRAFRFGAIGGRWHLSFIAALNPGRLLVGVVLIALGVVYLLDRLGVAQAGRLIGSLWPLVVIAAGLLQMAVTRRVHIGAVIVVLVGLLLLASSLHLLPANAWELFWPLVLIAIGVLFLAGVITRGGMHQTEQRDQAHAFSVFGGQRVISQSRQFRGASLTAFFGGVTLDLRQAKLAPDGADVDVMTAFGGAQILVPTGWLVLFSGIPIFGSFDDRTSHTGDEAGPQLRIRGTAMFGGVEAKNSP